ncbi:class B sortase [Hespellia stercorisuis]|uniref:Sortase B n=1 Tax=Hespellia stercorisuis DSM 15480 TaxID=1121950 RepID=A0A1M6I549_9FIRM|nr:class B sortase [Hespellia stercorisuis]SHJ29596.1 sortase B [Hespellia stercorisuis DSM 15480]
MNKYRLMQGAFFLLFCLAAGFLLHHMVFVPEQNQKKIEALKEEFPEVTSGAPASEEDPFLPAGKEGDIGGRDLLAMQARYPDLQAWLTIPGTGIDYPVLQSGEDDPEFYLKHNYRKEQDANGSLFFASDCNVKTSENLVLYGHNMNSGTMFGKLDLFTDAAYCKEHPIIQLQTPECMDTYEIVSVTKADTSMLPFTQVDFPGHDGILSYVDQAKRLGLFETGVSDTYYEQVLTLVTCSYEWKEAKTVVVAVKKAA